MKNIGEQQIIIECPNTIFHLYIDSEDELSKVKVFMNNIKHVDSISQLIYTTGATDSICSTRRHLIMTVK